MKEPIKVISKEEIDRLVDSTNKTKQENKAELEARGTVNIDKIIEVIKSLEGETVDTVTLVCSTLTILLPAANIHTLVECARESLVTACLKELGDAIAK